MKEEEEETKTKRVYVCERMGRGEQGGGKSVHQQGRTGRRKKCE